MGLLRGAARGLRAARNRLRGMDAGGVSTHNYSSPSALSAILQHTGAGAALGGGGGALHAGMTGGDMGEGALNGAMIGGALGAAIPGVAGARAFMGAASGDDAIRAAQAIQRQQATDPALAEQTFAQIQRQNPELAQRIMAIFNQGMP